MANQVASTTVEEWGPWMKSLLKRALARTPYRVIRASDRNRFAAQQETLLTLCGRGFAPKRIVDGGANVGDFARMIHSIFSHASIDLVEPQPACRPVLEALARSAPGHVLHAVAIGSERGTLSMAFDPEVPSTGAYVAKPEDTAQSPGFHTVPVETLDSILLGATVEDRVLLKLDLQGWELEALCGARRVLPVVEVILTEVSFFAQAYEPPIAALVGFLADQGFVLDDIASLIARRRDNRAHQADFVFIRADSPLNSDKAWA